MEKIFANLDETSEVMIAVSEPPLEYIPRGRPAVDEHPGPTETKQHPHLPSENILLQRLQNVNISAKEEHNEFWCVREIYEECERNEKTNKFETKKKDSATKCHKNSTDTKSKFHNSKMLSHTSPDEYVSEYLINSEEELYVKKHTAVWTKGIFSSRQTVVHIPL